MEEEWPFSSPVMRHFDLVGFKILRQGESGREHLENERMNRERNSIEGCEWAFHLRLEGLYKGGSLISTPTYCTRTYLAEPHRAYKKCAIYSFK